MLGRASISVQRWLSFPPHVLAFFFTVVQYCGTSANSLSTAFFFRSETEMTRERKARAICKEAPYHTVELPYHTVELGLLREQADSFFCPKTGTYAKKKSLDERLFLSGGGGGRGGSSATSLWDLRRTQCIADKQKKKKRGGSLNSSIILYDSLKALRWP